MAALGSACLFVGLLTALYAAGTALYGARTGRGELVVSARRAMYALAGLMVLATALLEAAYLRSEFSFALVTETSSTDTPTFYKVTAMWGSQAGSLLLWALLLSVFSSIVLRANRRRLREVVPYATAVLGGVAAFFIALMIFYASPFDVLASPPAEGNGLNPLLRHPAMMIHPPMLYTGYVGFAVPFAFAVGALVTRRTGADWIRATRRYALVAWSFLGVGILLGALWSFSELGWGGYWAWDPVENASLMPWLTGTAFIHSIMVQERRGMLRVWNVSLIAATFVLALLGTFLVRSGILDSIHAFGASTLGTPFLLFIAAVVIGSTALIATRAPELRSEARLDSLASREAVFLLNNLVLVLLCFVIFWLTFTPLISDAIGTRRNVGPAWYELYVTPLALVLVLLSGIGPLVAWRRVTVRRMGRVLVVPAALAAATVSLLLLLTSAAANLWALAMFGLGAFVVGVVAQEVLRGAGARRAMTGASWPAAVGGLVTRNRRRYGGYVVHIGIAVMFIGVAASSAFVEQRDVRLAPGQSVELDGYRVTYREPTARLMDDESGTAAPITLGAVLDVDKDGERFTVTPSRNYYTAGGAQSSGVIRRFFEGEATSEVAVRWGLREDLWVAVRPDLAVLEPAIAKADRDFADPRFADAYGLIVASLLERYRQQAPPAYFRTLVSPLVAWIWIGGGILLAGALFALWPAPGAAERRLRAKYAARVGRELSRA